MVIGPNGSGKSNFISVFAFLNAIEEGRLQDYVTKAGGAEKVLHFGSKTTGAIELHISFKAGVNQYKIQLAPAPGISSIRLRRRSYFGTNSTPHPITRD